ncbi:MAG TPA: carboxypeptidase-like regulatory domain-containing protein, partial [Aquaticitalea sp.]|nr:carboxypeptidase-like regulatory domain-containing protein [Aquaticitalea sp.]
MKQLTILFLFCLPFFGISQSATIKGIILDDAQLPVANVSITTGDTGTTSNENGFYELKIPFDTEVTIEFTHISHKRVVAKFKLKNGQEIEFNPVMSLNVEQIATVVINANTRHSVEG